jgi:hypothetical protein
MNEKILLTIKWVIMKLIHHILCVMYNFILLLIAAILLISIIIMAITKSWLYFFIYIPISFSFTNQEYFITKRLSETVTSLGVGLLYREPNPSSEGFFLF